MEFFFLFEFEMKLLDDGADYHRCFQFPNRTSHCPYSLIHELPTNFLFPIVMKIIVTVTAFDGGNKSDELKLEELQKVQAYSRLISIFLAFLPIVQFMNYSWHHPIFCSAHKTVRSISRHVLIERLAHVNDLILLSLSLKLLVE